jgi:hypothetical protein
MEREFAFHRPVHYFNVPEDERARRVRDSDDLCVIDGKIFFVRGVMNIPVVDQPGRWLGWGVWAWIGRRDFIRFCEGSERGAIGEPFRGRMAVSPPIYPNLLGAEVRIAPQEGTLRPVFEPASFEHPLFREHRDGITTARWHQIVTEIDEYQSRRRH